MNIQKHAKLSMALILMATLSACGVATNEEAAESDPVVVERMSKNFEIDEEMPPSEVVSGDAVSAPVIEPVTGQESVPREARGPASVPVLAHPEERRTAGIQAENAVIWCSAIGRRLPQDRCDNYAEQIADLRSGVAAFNPARSMVKDIPTEVRLAIGPEEEMERTIRRAGGEGEAQTAEIEIGAKMRARLTGRAFEIDPAQPVDQVMGRNRRQIWTWDVIPRRAGNHQLSAQITVLAEDGTVLENQSSEIIDVTVVVSEAERAALKREKTLEKRKALEEDVGWATGFLKILDDFSLALLALLTTVVIGGITLFVRARKAKNGEVEAVEGDEDS